jgi:DHA1 family multidrug resistance protein-like MFS transporter
MLRGLGVRENLETWIGYMMLVFYFIGFVINPIWGSIADHFGRTIMVLRAMLGMGFFMALVLRAYFAVTVMLTLGGLVLWLRTGRRREHVRA